MISTRKSKGWNPSKNLSIEKFSKRVICSPAMMFMTKRKKAVQTPLVEAGTISTITVNRMANQVSANR